MMRSACLPLMFAALWAAELACAQEAVPARLHDTAARLFARKPGETPLACDVSTLAPRLTYRLVPRAEYTVVIPLSELPADRRKLGVLIRITPKQNGARPVYLQDVEAIPEAPPEGAAKMEVRLRGQYFLGEGQYHAEAMVTSNTDRFCYRQWDISVKPGKQVKPLLAPGEIRSLAELRWPRTCSRKGRLTLVLNATSEESKPLLMQSAAAIIEWLGFNQVTLIAVNLSQHKEITRQTVKDAAGFQRVAKAVREFNPSTVSYGTLQNGTGHRDLLWKLLATEGPTSDMVLFLGFTTLDDSHVFVPPECNTGKHKTAYAYLQYLGQGQTWLRQRATVWQDAISRATKACGGRVYPVQWPEDLAVALAKLDKAVPNR